MLQKLAYFNLFSALLYMLIYFKSGNFNSTSGILIIVVFNWLSLRSYQLDDYKWKIWHYLTAIWSLYFIGTFVYGSINIASAAIEFNFITNDTLINLLASLLISISVCLHLALYFLKNYRTAYH